MSHELKLSIPGMKCNGCVSAIEKALATETGIEQLTISLENKVAHINTKIPANELIDKLKSAGFEASEIT